MTSEIVPADNMAELNTMTPQARELAVTQMLGEARAWLAHAVEATGPAQIANFKAQMATVAEATKQLNLSKEIQLDALEMVRRAERGVGLAIRKGQEEGSVIPPSKSGGRDPERISGMVHPEAILCGGGQANHETYVMTDGVSDGEFEEALTEAKGEGNLSRANVVRKIRDQKSPETRDQRAKKVAEFAATGHDRHQIAQAVGIHWQSVLKIAKDYGITITADAVTRNSLGRRNTDAQALEVCVIDCESVEGALAHLNPKNLGRESLDDIDSLIAAATAIARKARTIQNAIKESLS